MKNETLEEIEIRLHKEYEERFATVKAWLLEELTTKLDELFATDETPESYKELEARNVRLCADNTRLYEQLQNALAQK